MGDSPLDLPMLAQADEAIIAVSEPRTRSRSREDKLHGDLESGALRAGSMHQVLLPPTVPPRLDNTLLPTIDIALAAFLKAKVLPRRTVQHRGLRVLHAT